MENGDVMVKLKEIEEFFEKFGKEYFKEIVVFLRFFCEIFDNKVFIMREKEFIVLVFGIVVGCEWCIYFYIQKVFEVGVKLEEFIEVGFVVVLMVGGLVLMYFILFVKVIESF